MEIKYLLKDVRCKLSRGSDQAAGWDGVASLDQDVVLQPMERVAIPLGIILEMPEGMECQVRPRSGLAIKSGITILNTPGTIDSDFRGEVGAILINLSNTPFTIAPGMRICQLVFSPVIPIQPVIVEAISETLRGTAGFGSTGMK